MTPASLPPAAISKTTVISKQSQSKSLSGVSPSSDPIHITLPQRESVFSMEHEQSPIHSPLITDHKSLSHSKFSPGIVGEGDGQLQRPPFPPTPFLFPSTPRPIVQIAIAANTPRNRK